MLSLTLALRAVAILLLLMIVFGYLNSGELLIKQFIAANVLFALSFFSASGGRRIAVIVLALAVIIPLGVVQSYSIGKAPLELAIVTVVIFIYLAIIAIQSIRGGQSI